jgi:hypothetical protein
MSTIYILTTPANVIILRNFTLCEVSVIMERTGNDSVHQQERTNGGQSRQPVP